VRQRLLEVATRLFAERGFAEVGIREIAREARVTPGMIAYYFRDKLGLAEAMLDAVFEHMLAEIRSLAARPPRDVEPLEAFLNIYIQTVARAPWIPRFLLREVLTADGPLRRRFVKRYASRLAAVAPALLQREIEAGRVRPDLDPGLALLSIVGMCILPFLAAPVVGPLIGVAFDGHFPARLTEQVTRIALDGARARGGAR
jgi:AcrR family transcriptional regulator